MYSFPALVTVGGAGEILLRHPQHLVDRVDHDADRAAADVQHHDPAIRGQLGFGQREPGPQVDHRDDRAAKIDQPLDVGGRFGDVRDLTDQDDLPDLGDLDPVGLARPA